jgi:hypothetical protein
MFSRPDSAHEGPGTGTALAEPPGEHARIGVQAGDKCDAACTAKVQVIIETSAGQLGFCAHHGRETFDRMIMQGSHPPQPRHVGDIKPWV